MGGRQALFIRYGLLGVGTAAGMVQAAPLTEHRPPPCVCVLLPLSQLKEKHSGISYRDVMSAAMYPKVFEEYK